MLGKTSIIFFLFLVNLVAFASLQSELEMLQNSAANIELHAWDSAQTKVAKQVETGSDSISLTSSALRKPAILKKDQQMLEELPEIFEIKKTRKRSR
ncbi:hypothetical protein A9Q84_13330 [Halobacteriovorax marinus]|uniref:Uncharacterized protein n=1 Tax=Halobacteriovorax marinus TaxID=97084 RepID=A0A1Y5FFC3_9BACT|nr:hypothetical protein A9Q84_13330 [Halobacteriovorax marinus]